MNTFLLTWNPKYFPLDEEDFEDPSEFSGSWTCRTGQIRPGDRVFLLRQGQEPRGIVAAGKATSEQYKDKHYANPKAQSQYVDVAWDALVDPSKEPVLSLQDLRANGLARVNWRTQSSGIRLDPEAAATIETLWAALLARRHAATDEPVNPKALAYMEGALRRVISSRHERDPKARLACIEHYGTACFVCGFSFEEKFGAIGRGFIHVHHLEPIAGATRQKCVDPVRDLRPVCPNCHAMLHREDPPLSVEKLMACRH
jgi:5-methylcytosine-specific restriction protein A